MSKIIKTMVDFASSGVSVVPRELLLASDQGRELLYRAKEEAMKIREKAKAILADALREREIDRARGYEEGRQEGLAQVTERLAALEVEREKLLRGEEKEIIAMVLEIAEKIVARELKKGAVRDVVRQALTQAVGSRLVVRVNPEDKEKIEQDFSDLRGTSRTLALEEDESITPGGCLVETELGTVDARLETQWKAIRKALGVE